MNPYELIEARARQAKTLDEATRVLAGLIGEGFSVLPDGRLYNIRELVGRIDGLSVHIYADEHPPPHFHVRGGGLDVSFSIVDGTVTQGQIRGRHRQLVAWWYARSRPLLVETWNRTRPPTARSARSPSRTGVSKSASPTRTSPVT